MDIKVSDILKHLSCDSKRLVFFDLDSTIYDLSKRQIKILKEFADHDHARPGYKELCENIKSNEFGRMPFYPVDALKKYTISYPDDFESVFFPFWETRFFSHEYLKYDAIEPGVNRFVHELINLNVDIVYLTGRDEPRMGMGTKTKLRHDKLYNDGEELILKPDKKLIDREFKLEVVQKKHSQYDKIVFIDNEAANVNHIYNNLNNVYCVFYDSVHSEKEAPLSNLHILKHFE